MRSTDTKCRRLILKALLLVWLVVFSTPPPANADKMTPPRAPSASIFDHDGPEGFQPALRDGSPSVVEIEGTGPYASSPYGFEAQHSRADLYTLVKLAVDELEFLAGLRLIWDKTEKKVNNLALKLKLKGDISLNREGGSSGSNPSQSDLAAIHALSTRNKSSRMPLSLRAIFLPKKIRWHFGYDPNNQAAFGELKWGSFIAVQSDVGADQEVKLVFQYTF